LRKAHAIRLLVLDVDGVLTDGRLYFGPRGEALKAFDVRDGAGIVELQRGGGAVAVREVCDLLLAHDTRRGRRR
jgi:3-deoxy-D-manno-octulosonate 8-phosphate phosphatase (KDO 8-P phosphatase)